jgi:hypothetical protein
MIRKAIVHELQQPFGVEPPPASDWLQALARALIVKAGQRATSRRSRKCSIVPAAGRRPHPQPPPRDS